MRARRLADARLGHSTGRRIKLPTVAHADVVKRERRLVRNGDFLSHAIFDDQSFVRFDLGIWKGPHPIVHHLLDRLADHLRSTTSMPDEHVSALFE